MYGREVTINQYFPNQKIRKRILLKSFLGLLIGCLVFATSVSMIATGWLAVIDQDYSFGNLSKSILFIFALTIWWSLIYTTIPAILCVIALTFVIYRDSRKGEISRYKAMVTGIKFVGLLGLLISLLFAFTFFRSEHVVSMLPYAIPVTLIAGCVGAWGGLQVYTEIINFQEN